MKAKTLTANSLKDLEIKLQQCILEEFNPTLAIVFSAIPIGLEGICELFDREDIELMGCSTAGEIVNDQYFDGVAACLLLNPDRNSFSVTIENYGQEGPFQAGKKLGNTAKNCFPNPALIVCSGGVVVDAEQIVYGLKAGLGSEAPIYGGLAGDNLGFKQTFAFSRKGVTENGLVSLVVDHDKIEVKGLATSGWEPFGMENTVTRSKGNVIYTINHEPALDVFVRYFGYFDNTGLKGKNISTISAQYPLQILRNDGTTVLRSPLVGNESERTLTLAGGVKEGDKFRFSISPSFEVIDQTIEDFGKLRKEAETADALILFSCKGRHAALGPMIEDEIKGIYDYWKKPMIGFFTYGEIGPTRTGVCEFHNETCSLVVLRERMPG